MVKATQSIGPLRPISTSANEQVARLIVERISRTPPYRMSWREYAVTEITRALNAAGRRQ
jgi:hypothetical protein